jgi:hypothetical protein
MKDKTMDFMNDGDDGFSDPPNTLKSRGSNYLRWDDDHGWRDRDGVPPKGALIVVRIGECIMRWAEKQQTLITHKPLPDIDELNKAVPTKEWSVGFSGQPEPPYKAAVFVLAVDPENGATYRYVHHTVGARIAFDDLREATAVMRHLRGEQVYPVVTLGERPMKKRGGVWGKRPHFEIVDWKSPGGDEGGQALPAPTTPQLAAPAESSTPPATEPVAKEPRSHPIPAPTTKPPSAKRPVTVSAYTKATLTGTVQVPGMTDVKPPTTEELLNDSLDDMPWDSTPNNKS